MTSEHKSWWQYHGKVYQFGRCFIDQDRTLMYVPIEKTATRVIQSMVTTLEFQELDFFRSKNQAVPAMVVLRDPVQRWVSGLVEYLLRTKQNLDDMTKANFVAQVFDQVLFDIHTCPQHRFVAGLEGQTTYIWFDQKQKPQLIECVSKYFNEHGFANEWTPNKFPNTDNLISDSKKQLTQLFEDMLQRPDMLQKIKTFYSKDYELIESIKFYS